MAVTADAGMMNARACACWRCGGSGVHLLALPVEGQKRWLCAPCVSLALRDRPAALERPNREHTQEVYP